MVHALRKQKKDSDVYRRRHTVEKILEDWDTSPPDVLVKQFEKAGDTVPTEVLVYLLRHKDIPFNSVQFETLFDSLVTRVTKILVSKVSDQVYERAESIREEILGKFIELIAMERNEPGTRLDYYEVNFNHALESLRIDYLRTQPALYIRSVPLSAGNEGVIDISPEVEEAVRRLVDQESSQWSDLSFRSTVLSAINELPSDQKLVIGLLLQGLPIESTDKNTMTISRALDCTDRTVRNRRNKAYETLREKLAKEGLL